MHASNNAAQDRLGVGMSMSNPVNTSFQGLYNMAQSMSAGRIAGDSSETPPSDTTIYEPWISCALVTTINNNDGSITTTYDYGDGCEEGNADCKYWMMGKYAFTYRSTYNNIGSIFKDDYYYESSTENYGGKYYTATDTSAWIMNGTSVYEGESEYDTAHNTYNGNYRSSYDYIYTWNNETYLYKGVSKASYTEKKYVFEQNNYEYKNGNDYYKTEILEPLVMRYDCNNFEDSFVLFNYIWTYVSGREFVRYKQGDQEGSFEIIYGDGSCDNIITIIENGKRVEVDLGKQPVYAWD